MIYNRILTVLLPYWHCIPIVYGLYFYKKYGRKPPTRITAEYGSNTTVHVPYSSTWGVRIGINGFGRVGRAVFRCAIEQGILIRGVNG